MHLAKLRAKDSRGSSSVSEKERGRGDERERKRKREITGRDWKIEPVPRVPAGRSRHAGYCKYVESTAKNGHEAVVVPVSSRPGQTGSETYVMVPDTTRSAALNRWLENQDHERERERERASAGFYLP